MDFVVDLFFELPQIRRKNIVTDRIRRTYDKSKLFVNDFEKFFFTRLNRFFKLDGYAEKVFSLFGQLDAVFLPLYDPRVQIVFDELDLLRNGGL